MVVRFGGGGEKQAANHVSQCHYTSQPRPSRLSCLMSGQANTYLCSLVFTWNFFGLFLKLNQWLPPPSEINPIVIREYLCGRPIATRKRDAGKSSPKGKDQPEATIWTPPPSYSARTHPADKPIYCGASLTAGRPRWTGLGM